VHVEWLHAYSAQVPNVRTTFGAPPKHLKVGFNPFDCGIIYRCAIEGAT